MIPMQNEAIVLRQKMQKVHKMLKNGPVQVFHPWYELKYPYHNWDEWLGWFVKP